MNSRTRLENERSKSKHRQQYIKQNLLNTREEKLFSPKLSAKSWIVVDSDSGDILYGFNEHTRREIASLTKVMTSYVVLEMCQQMDVVMANTYAEVSESSSKVGGTSAQLCAGDLISIENLFHALMLPSGNDAALTFAENFGIYSPHRKQNQHQNSIQLFVQEMNTKAKELQLNNTSYANPHGLNNKQNKSTAADVAKLCNRVMKNDFFRKVVNTKLHFCTVQDDEGFSRQAIWENTNRLLHLGFKGIKTGFTSEAGPCLASYYKGVNRNFTIVILGCKTSEDRWDETNRLLQWCLQTISKS